MIELRKSWDLEDMIFGSGINGPRFISMTMQKVIKMLQVSHLGL
jgi:hypothetical protein